jgi:hypothetical protein
MRQQRPTNQAPKGTFDGKTSAEIATLLKLLDDVPSSENRNLLKAWLTDELVARHPETQEPLDLWSENLDDPRTMTEVLLEALPDDVRKAIYV